MRKYIVMKLSFSSTIHYIVVIQPTENFNLGVCSFVWLYWSKISDVTILFWLFGEDPRNSQNMFQIWRCSISHHKYFIANIEIGLEFNPILILANFQSDWFMEQYGLRLDWFQYFSNPNPILVMEPGPAFGWADQGSGMGRFFNI